MNEQEYQKAYSIIKPTAEKIGLTEEEITELIFYAHKPTAKEFGESIKRILSKIKN